MANEMRDMVAAGADVYHLRTWLSSKDLDVYQMRTWITAKDW